MESLYLLEHLEGQEAVLQKQKISAFLLLDISFQKVDHPAITSVKNVPFSLPGPQVKNLLLKSRKGKKIYLVILPDEKLFIRQDDKIDFFSFS